MVPIATTSKTPGSDGLSWPSLITGTLIKRYKRFLVDVELDDGRIVTAHCPNTGSMQSCSEPGRRVYLSVHDNPKRKYPYTWEMIAMPNSLVGINTLMPNRLIKHAVNRGQIPELEGYDAVGSEVRFGENSRVDLLLSGPGTARCYVEIKNCTLVRDKTALFPDAVTARGLKHLQELARQIGPACRSVIFFFVQRMDAVCFRPADTIDPDYGQGLRQAVAAGVEMMVYDVHIDLAEIRLRRALPYRL
ncbi:MAG: DNA/RNA nuclease SfsA [Desulfobacterales bacterium]|nr:DNA/RNA nuclease SfsA [Desulfobacterales bacterium]